MSDNCKDSCPVLPRVEALEDANKNHIRAREGIYDRLRKMETENAVQNAHYKEIDKKLDRLTVMVQEITGKSGRRWDGLVDKLIFLAAGAVLAWVSAGAPVLGT